MAYKVLVIDDEEAIVGLLELWLDFAGYEVYSATSGQAGLAQVSEHSPDLVISDVLMPSMDGYEFCRRMKGLSRAPVIMLTGLGKVDEEEQKAKRLNLDVAAFISKPLSMSEFMQTVEEVLTSRDSIGTRA